MSPTTNERAPPTEMSTGSQIRALAFTANGDYLVSGDKEAVRVWRVADNQQVGMMKAKDVRCIAVSQDGRWIAVGKSWGETTVLQWDSQKFDLKEVFTHDDGHTVTSVDFSPDSTRLVTASGGRAASIWDIATRKVVVGPLEHSYWVVAAKFSPRGDRIATATFLRADSVRVYDSRNGNLLVNIPVKVTPYYNTGLLWSNDSIVVLSNDTIKQINVATTLVVSEWPVPADNNYPCILSPTSGKFIIYSAGCTVTFCSKSTHTQRPPIQLIQDTHAIALSPDNRFLAIGGGDGKIVFEGVPRSNVAHKSGSVRTKVAQPSGPPA